MKAYKTPDYRTWGMKVWEDLLWSNTMTKREQDYKFLVALEMMTQEQIQDGQSLISNTLKQ